MGLRAQLYCACAMESVKRVPPNNFFAGGTVPPNNYFAGGTVPPNNFFDGGTVPPNNFFGGGTVPPNSHFPNIYKSRLELKFLFKSLSLGFVEALATVSFIYPPTIYPLAPI